MMPSSFGVTTWYFWAGSTAAANELRPRAADRRNETRRIETPPSGDHAARGKRSLEGIESNIPGHGPEAVVERRSGRYNRLDLVGRATVQRTRARRFRT